MAYYYDPGAFCFELCFIWFCIPCRCFFDENCSPEVDCCYCQKCRECRCCYSWPCVNDDGSFRILNCNHCLTPLPHKSKSKPKENRTYTISADMSRELFIQ
jgi:hypothetical protein